MSRKQKKLILALALLFALNIFLIALAQSASADLYKRGSSGAVVREIQTRLKNWGYYSGAVDGVYGSKTEEAVRWFQRKNGLTADGQAGSQTLAALGIPETGAGGSSGGDLQLLARLISAEARGEPYTGKVAVAAVVLNRVRSAAFPNTISGVIFQAGAFDCVRDGQIWLTPDSESLRAANDALAGWDPTAGCVYYYNPATATSSWIWSREVRLSIGAHAFAV